LTKTTREIEKRYNISTSNLTIFISFIITFFFVGLVYVIHISEYHKPPQEVITQKDCKNISTWIEINNSDGKIDLEGQNRVFGNVFCTKDNNCIVVWVRRECK
jgi:hypothetical protein